MEYLKNNADDFLSTKLKAKKKVKNNLNDQNVWYKFNDQIDNKFHNDTDACTSTKNVEIFLSNFYPKKIDDKLNL